MRVENSHGRLAQVKGVLKAFGIRASSSMQGSLALVGLALAVAAVLCSGCGASNDNKHDAEVRTLADSMAQEEMAFLYRHNIQDYVKAQSRDVEVVRTGTLRASRQARAQIEAGVPFARVAARFSADARSKTFTGLVKSVVRSQEDPPLAKAVFSAKLHVLVGPVRLEPGNYYVLRVKAINPPKNVTLTEYEKLQFSPTESRLEHYRRLYYAQLKSQG